MRILSILLLLLSCVGYGQTYYVTTGGSGTTCSSGSPCTITYAAANAVAGDVWWVKAGDYGNITLTVSNNGTLANPIMFKGYKTTTGDVVASSGSTFSYGDTLDSAEMPLFDATTDGVGTAITCEKDYVEFHNFQITDYRYGYYNATKQSGQKLNNLIITESGDASVGSFNGWGILTDMDDGDIRNCFVLNATGEGMSIRGSNNYHEYNAVICDNGAINNTDYYYKFHYDADNNEVHNAYVKRYLSATQHQGHGLITKGETSGANDGAVNNDFYDFTVINTTLELSRSEGGSNNFYRGIVDSEAGADYGGILIRDGSDFNHFEDIDITGSSEGIRFGNFAFGGDTFTSPEDENAGHDNTFLRVTVDITNTSKETSAVNFFSFNSQTAPYRDEIASDNIFTDCEFSNLDNLLLVDRPSTGTEFIGCTFTNITNETGNNSTQGPDSFDYTHTCSTVVNSFTFPAESPSCSVYYVTDSGSGTDCTLGSPCDIEYAIETKADTPGDTVWVKAGTYSNFLITQTDNGTALNPIVIAGYKTTPGDLDEDAQTTKTLGPKTVNVLSSFAYGDVVNSVEMPLLSKSNFSGGAITLNGDYVHIYNMQFEQYNRAIWVAGDNCVLKNLISINANEGFRNEGASNTWKNVYIENALDIMITVRGNNGNYDGFYLAVDDARVGSDTGTDYGFLFQGGDQTVIGNNLTNLYAWRVDDVGHYGRGLVFKSDQETHSNTVTDFIIDDTVLEVSGETTHDNIIQDGYMHTTNGGDASPGMRLSNGAYDNTFLNVHLKGNGIVFGNTYTNFDSLTDGADGFVFNQCIFDFTGNAFDGIRFMYYNATGGFTQSNDDNTFYNCTFYNAGNALFEDSRANSNTQFINCIIDTFSKFSQTRAGSPGYTIDDYYTSTNFYNITGFSIPTGTDVTNIDPEFTSPGTGDFTVESVNAAFTDGIATPYLPIGNTLGAVQATATPTGVAAKLSSGSISVGSSRAKIIIAN